MLEQRQGTMDSDVTSAAPEGTTRPVVFLDYSGLVLSWLRLKADDERLQYLLSKKLDEEALSDAENPPVAAVLAGIDLDILKSLSPDCAFIEIRKRD